MKNRIISLLLVMVMTLTMTACVANADASASTTEPAIIGTVVPNEYEGLVKPLWYDEIEKMDSEEIFDYISEMVKISNSNDLRLEDMRVMAWNFACIWKAENFPSDQEANFKIQFSQAFNNIYDQTIEQQIPLNTLYAWTYVPNAEVICKYLSSSNFNEPNDVECLSFEELTAEEKIRVAKAFFENPLLRLNTSVPSTIICNSPDEEITNMALEHFVNLIKNGDEETISIIYELVEILDEEHAQILLNALEKHYIST